MHRFFRAELLEDLKLDFDARMITCMGRSDVQVLASCIAERLSCAHLGEVLLVGPESALIFSEARTTSQSVTTYYILKLTHMLP